MEHPHSPKPAAAKPDEASGSPRKGLVGLLGWFERHVELCAAISLSIATLLTSWSGYEATLFDGRQAAAYTKANNVRTTAARLAGEAGQHQAADLLMFSQWLNAYASRDQRLQRFYRKRFRPEFTPAFEAWVATRPDENPYAPITPFVMPEYQLEAQHKARRLEQQADALLEEGEAANRIGDSFVQATVVLASAMFFGGICQVFDKPKVRVVLLGLSVAACLAGLVKVAALPVLLHLDGSELRLAAVPWNAVG